MKICFFGGRDSRQSDRGQRDSFSLSFSLSFARTRDIESFEDSRGNKRAQTTAPSEQRPMKVGNINIPLPAVGMISTSMNERLHSSTVKWEHIQR